MARSRKKYKRNRTKVRIALPKKKPHVFKPAFTIPKLLLSSSNDEGDGKKREWNNTGSVIENYRTFGVVANPNLLGVRSRTPHIVQCPSLQLPVHHDDDRGNKKPMTEFDLGDSGSDLESDDLKSALGKTRRDGKAAPMRALTTIQRVHIGRLIDKYGDDYEAMFKDIKLNAMQHSLATLRKLCQRYNAKDKFYINVKK